MTTNLRSTPRGLMPHVTSPANNEASDSELLRQFLAKREESAFRELAERHGPLVLGVCRRNTYAAEDAEDAFQATFLVLAQSAGSIRRGASLSAWLYGVALRVSARVRRSRPSDHSRPLEEDVAQLRDPLDELLARHDGMIADEELSALPEKLRKPLVLRYLAGKSNQETAAELGITVAAVEGRLKRGKTRLRARLLRRGVTLAAVVATLKATQVTAGGLPESLVTATTSLSCGPALSSSPASLSEPTTTNIAFEELQAMNMLTIPKLFVPFGAASVALLALGVHLAHSQGPADGTAALTLQSAVEQAVSTAPQVTTRIASAPATEPSPPAAANAAGMMGAKTPKIVDAKPRTQNERRIEETLEEPQRAIDFDDEPLEQVVEYLRVENNIPIVFDESTLVGLGIAKDAPVTIDLPSGLQLESVLNHLLTQLDLEAIVRDEALLITTQTRAASLYEPRVYPLRSMGLDAESLRKTLIYTVQPNTWEQTGGTGDIEALPSGDLLIRQTYAGHREVAEVLRQLMASQTSRPAANAAPREQTELQFVSPPGRSRGRAGVSAPRKQTELQLVSTPETTVQTLRALKRRYEILSAEIESKQTMYNNLLQESESALSPAGELQNKLDIELLTQLRTELLEMRRQDAMTDQGAAAPEYREELKAQIDDLTDAVLQRARPDADLLRRKSELEQLQRIANDLLSQIEDLETQRAVAEEHSAVKADN